MSIRRQSCNACFQARRKCDLGYPSCARCQQRNKTCHYIYPPQVSQRETVDTKGPVAIQVHSANQSTHSRAEASIDQDNMLHYSIPQDQSIPRLLYRLGELPPLSGATGFTWVFDQIRDCPFAFARQAETIFIHKGLFGPVFPRPLRAAFGICAACVSMTPENRFVIFQALDAEIFELLERSGTTTLIEDLVTLQASVLYQIIRLYYGGLEERIVAERQEFLIRSFGLTLLRRADSELRDAQQTWEDWILAESIRRTVVIAFKLYTVYSTFKHGLCAEIAAISMLPVSTKSGSWKSRQVFTQYPDRDETITYADFSSLWDVAPHNRLEVFEKILVVGCKGMDKFELLTGPRSAVE